MPLFAQPTTSRRMICHPDGAASSTSEQLEARSQGTREMAVQFRHRIVCRDQPGVGNHIPPAIDGPHWGLHARRGRGPRRRSPSTRPHVPGAGVRASALWLQAAGIRELD